METDTFGARLKSYRLRAGLTQEELAEHARLSTRALSDLERGLHRKPRQDTLVLLIEALHLSAEEQAHLTERVPRHRGPVSALTPPKRAADVVLHWPVPLTRLIGREREESAASHLLHQTDVRLLTLTGPAGVGKTRLALQLAESLAGNFANGVQVVSLAAIQEPSLVLSALAEGLEVRETSDLSLLKRLQMALRPQQRLLVLDNFEHLLAAAPLLVDLLTTCPQVKALVTSRARLRVRGEYELVVPPLDLPDLDHLPALTDLGQYGAVALFVARANAIQPTFALTERLAPLVAELCVRLDGLPLAIELAAARLKILPLWALVAQLQDRLALLTGGARDLPERQQTMRQAIGWSYGLLSAEQQQLFRRLAVFAGSWTLAAAEQICGAVGEPERSLLEAVAILVDQSLVQPAATLEGEAPRFLLLETLRAFGLGQMEFAGEREAFRRRHATYYLKLGEQVGRMLFGKEHPLALRQCAQEQANLRTALDWARESGEGEMGLRLAVALWHFWHQRGQLREGRSWLEEMLSRPMPTDERGSTLRAHALNGAGTLAFGQGDFTAARAWLEESVALFRRLGNRQWIGAPLNNLALLEGAQGNYLRAKALHEENLAAERAKGERGGVAICLVNLGNVAAQLGDVVQAEEWLAESLALFGELEDKDGEAEVFALLGDLAWHQGDLAQAETLLQEAQKRFGSLEEPLGSAQVLTSLGQVARAQGAWERARACFVESLARLQAIGNQRDLIISLEGLAGLLAEQGHQEQAAQLFGRAVALREELGAPGSPYERQVALRDMKQLHAALGEGAFTTALTIGRALALDQVLAENLQR